MWNTFPKGALVVLCASACLLASTRAGAAPNGGPRRGVPPWMENEETPLQKKVKAALAGNKGPDASYRFEVLEDTVPVKSSRQLILDPDDAPPPDPPPPGRRLVVRATTKLVFDGPGKAHKNGAPLDKWEGMKGRHHDGSAVDKTSEYVALLEKAFPASEDAPDDPDPDSVVESSSECSETNPCPSKVAFWDRYERDKEPRTHVITETITYIEPEPSPSADVLGAAALDARSAQEPVLMGFTYVGPNIDHSIGDALKVCIKWLGCATIYEFKAGFTLDWALGLRLAGSLQLSTPTAQPLVAGQSYPLYARFEGENWTADDYAAYGILPERGREFVMRFNFFVGVKAKLLGANLCPGCYVEVNVPDDDDDIVEQMDFKTPVGSDLLLPSLSLPIYTWDLAALSFEIGLALTPKLEAPSVVAAWQGLTRATGGGEVTFPATEDTYCGEFTACLDGSGLREAVVRVSDPRYRIAQFALGLGVYLELEIFGQGAWDPRWEIATIGLGSLGTGDGIGAHQQCDALWNCSRIGPLNQADLVFEDVDDVDAPSTSIAFAAPGGTQGWHVSDVEVTLDAQDLPPGCGIGVQEVEYSTGGAATVGSAPTTFTLTAEGVTTVGYRAADRLGNEEPLHESVIRIDKTPPVVFGAPTTTANGNGWYNTDVVVHFSATDAVSGLFSVTPDRTLSDDGFGQSVDGEATDNAGHRASATVSGVNIDKTPPAVAILAPEPRTYVNTEPLVIAWTATDLLSGVAATEGWMDGRPVANPHPVDLLLVPAGLHAVDASAIDKADNRGSARATFALEVDIHGLIAATRHVCDLAWIGASGTCRSLLAKLAVARDQIARGAISPAANLLQAFVAELDAQNGKAVSAAAYDLLKTDAIFVQEHLGSASP